MSSAAEARFRVQAPNSTPRAITVIALDATSEVVVRRLAGAGWPHSTFLIAGSPEQPLGVLRDLSGKARILVGPDAYVFDALARIAPTHYYSVIGYVQSKLRANQTEAV